MIESHNLQTHLQRSTDFTGNLRLREYTRYSSPSRGGSDAFDLNYLTLLFIHKKKRPLPCSVIYYSSMHDLFSKSKQLIFSLFPMHFVNAFQLLHNLYMFMEFVLSSLVNLQRWFCFPLTAVVVVLNLELFCVT